MYLLYILLVLNGVPYEWYDSAPRYRNSYDCDTVGETLTGSLYNAEYVCLYQPEA